MCKGQERPLFQGVIYSVEEENPDHTVLLDDFRVPGAGEGSLLGFMKYWDVREGALAGSAATCIFPATTPGPVRAAARCGEYTSHPKSSRMVGWIQAHPMEASADHWSSSPEVWHIPREGTEGTVRQQTARDGAAPCRTS